MADVLLPAELIALTVARDQLTREVNPELNVSPVLVMTVERLERSIARTLAELDAYTYHRSTVGIAVIRHLLTHPDREVGIANVQAANVLPLPLATRDQVEARVRAERADEAQTAALIARSYANGFARFMETELMRKGRSTAEYIADQLEAHAAAVSSAATEEAGDV